MNGAQFAREVRLAFDPQRAWAEIARETAAYARQDRDAKIRAGQFPARFETFVNGQRGAREETIRPGGVIHYQGQALGQAVALALAELRKRVPVRSGDYRDSFVVGVSRGGVEGSPIPWNRFRADAVTADATTAYIASPRPFSRMLDVQIAGNQTIKVKVPPGFFADAVAVVRRAFPQLAVARLGNVRLPDTQRRSQSGRRIEYPAIRISAGL